VTEDQTNPRNAADPLDPTSLDGADRISRIERDDAGRLIVHLTDGKEPIQDAKVARCFPWSVPGTYISICDHDGKEHILIKSLDDLGGETRRLVEEELRERVFNPKIRRVVGHKHEFGITSIMAETDRGDVTFQIRSRDDVHVLSDQRALFRDADGITYELPDLSRLDADSRKRLLQYF